MRVLRSITTAILAIGLISCLRTAEEKSANWVKSARNLMERKEYSSAIIELHNAIQANPRNADAFYVMGLALMESAGPETALWYFKTAADLNPKLAGAHLKLADLLSGAGTAELLAQSEKHANAALALLPDDPEALHALAFAEWRQRKTALAVEHLQKALTRSPGHVKSATTLAIIEWSANHDAAAAEKILRNALKLSSESVEALISLGRFYTVSGRSSEAEFQFRRVLERDTDNESALLELSQLTEKSGRQLETEQILKKLSNLPNTHYRTVYAQFLFHDGRREAAINDLKRHLAKEPGAVEVRSRLVDFYLVMHRVDDAEKLLNDSLRRNPRDPNALERQAELQLHKKNFAEAAKLASEALRLRPQSAALHHILATALRWKGDHSESLQHLRRAVEFDPFLLKARVDLSEALRTGKSLKEALDLLDHTPAKQQEELSYLTERVWVLIGLRRSAEAKPLIRKSLSSEQGFVQIMQAGLVELQERNHATGRAFLEEALKKSPQDLEILNTLANSLAAEKQPYAAVERIRRQSAQFQQSASLQFLLGYWLERAGDQAGAYAAYVASLRIDPTFTRAAIAASRLDLTQGRPAEARTALNGVLEREPRNIDALLAIGMLEEGLGHYETAIATYRKLLHIAPNHLVAKNNLAVRLSENSATLDEALMLAQQVKESVPDQYEVDDTIGWIYYKKGIYKTAVKYLQTAAARSKSARIKYHLSIAYFGAGDWNLGQETLEVAQKLDPKLPEAEWAKKMAQASEKR